jgi:hypothetical protein
LGSLATTFLAAFSGEAGGLTSAAGAAGRGASDAAAAAAADCAAAAFFAFLFRFFDIEIKRQHTKAEIASAKASKKQHNEQRYRVQKCSARRQSAIAAQANARQDLKQK